MFGVIIAAAGTSIRKGIFRLITVWIGAAFGIMVKLFYLWYGIKGFGLFFVSLIPQYIFYWMAYGLLYWESEEKYMRSRTNYFPIILTIGVVIMGILLESYVNPILVSGYAKILF